MACWQIGWALTANGDDLRDGRPQPQPAVAWFAAHTCSSLTVVRRRTTNGFARNNGVDRSGASVASRHNATRESFSRRP